jgi:hypothetical protein
MGMNGYFVAVSHALANALLENQELVMPLVLAGAMSSVSAQFEGLRDLAGDGEDFPSDPSGGHQGDMQGIAAVLRAAGFEPTDVRDALGVGSAWHALHFTLAGTAWEPTDAPGDAVLGGSAVGESEYGTIRVLTSSEVARTAAALDVLPSEAFASRIQPEAMAENDIYAGDDCDSSDGREMLVTMYTHLREYFGAAALRKDGMLIYVA